MNITEINTQLKGLKRKYFIFVYSLLALILLSVFLFMTRGMAGFLPVFPAVICGVLAKKYQLAYISSYKENVVRVAVSSCGFIENLTYDEKDGISETDVASFGAIKESNVFSSGDRITGTAYGTDFSVCDVFIGNRRSLGGDSHTTTLFRGQWMTVRLERPSDFTVQLSSKSLRCAETMRGLQPYTDDSAFFDAFSVYTDYAEGMEKLFTEENKNVVCSLRKRLGCDFMIILRGEYADAAFDTGMDSYDSALTAKSESTLDEAQKRVLDGLRETVETVRAVAALGKVMP